MPIVENNPGHWFEVPVTDLPRAQAFYEKVLGVSLKPLEHGGMKMAWFPRKHDSDGSSGSLIQGPGRTPSKGGALVYFTVSDIDRAIANLNELGGRIVTPKTSGDFGSIAHVEDCEGNTVALYSEK